MPTVKAPREHNKSDWQRLTWSHDMIDAINGQSHFRWFDSGDMYSLKLANKMLTVMKASPGTKFWLPTRMHKFAKFKPVLAKMAALPNVVVRKSSDHVEARAFAIPD